MTKILFCLFVLISTSCFAVVTQESFQFFLKDYFSSNERTFWPETIYALEKDYDDDMIIFCLDKFGLKSPIYLSRNATGDFVKKLVGWGNNKTPIDVKNLLIECVKKKRLSLLKVLLPYFSENDIRYISEYRLSYDPQYKPKGGYTDTKIEYERQVLNIVIREVEDCLEYVELFLQYGVYVNSQDFPERNTPLSEAFAKLNKPLIKFLLDNKANPNVPFASNLHVVYWEFHPLNLLHWTIEQNRLDLAEMLLEKGTCIDADAKLSFAISIRNVNAVILLLNFGADPLNKRGIKTPLELAFEVNDPEIIDILIAVIYSKEDL